MKKHRAAPSAPITDQVRQGDVLVHPAVRTKRGAARTPDEYRPVVET